MTRALKTMEAWNCPGTTCWEIARIHLWIRTNRSKLSWKMDKEKQNYCRKRAHHSPSVHVLNLLPAQSRRTALHCLLEPSKHCSHGQLWEAWVLGLYWLEQWIVTDFQSGRWCWKWYSSCIVGIGFKHFVWSLVHDLELELNNNFFSSFLSL